MPFINLDHLDVIQIITGVLKAERESCYQTELKQIRALHCVTDDWLEIVSSEHDRSTERVSLRQQENGDFL